MDYDDILNAIDALEPAGQLQVARYILNQLVSDDEPDDDETEAPAITRQSLPRLRELYRAGEIRQGDVVYMAPKKHQQYRSQFAVLDEPNKVRYGDQILRINDWACDIYGHQAINIYEHVIVDRLQKTLGEIRRAYMTRSRGR